MYVTLPDGSVADRTSKTREYTHAIVCHPEEPELVIADRKQRMADHEAVIADISEALGAEKLKVRSKQLSRGRGNPDVDYQGRPSYNGFEYHAYSADGKKVLATVRGNSRQETRGGYDENGKYDGDKPGTAFVELRRHLEEKKSQHEGWKNEAEATIKSVQDGTYDLGGYSAYNFSSSAVNAEKLARSNQGQIRTRRFSVQEIDQ